LEEFPWRGGGVFLREKSFSHWNFSMEEGIFHGREPDFPDLYEND